MSALIEPVPTAPVRAALAKQGLPGLGLVGTRIIDFRVEPARPAVGELVRIAGRLQHHKPPFCWWGDLGDKTVELLMDGRRVAETLTGPTGEFTFRWTFRKTGVYWVKARFAGDWVYSGCESHELAVVVITPEERAEEERRFWMLVGGAGLGIAAIIGGVIWYSEEQRRRERLIALLA